MVELSIADKGLERHYRTTPHSLGRKHQPLRCIPHRPVSQRPPRLFFGETRQFVMLYRYRALRGTLLPAFEFGKC